ncbi:recombination protein RecO [Helicobacter pametensis]|uniref:recombination protein RecO n=1 Tax=Helicobacter pametensis TaxID=95149 RepID=UPI000487423D|nr:recombination protein RecO [Helicobacter pametensis]
MQGFILSIQIIKNQDLIVKILTSSQILDLYRFYGVRHSILSVGKKVDFDIQYDGLFMPKMRNILEFGYPWEQDYARTYVWQIFIKLLLDHLRDVSDLDGFYFALLERGAQLLGRQNPMRVALEMSAALIMHEGRNARIHHNRCFLCDEDLSDEIGLGRAFLFAHPKCIGGERFEKVKIFDFLDRCSTLALDDDEVERLWRIFSLGL